MAQSRINVNSVIGALAMIGTKTFESEGSISVDPVMAAGNVGKISAAGVDNMTTGHTILAADTVDVHWADPADGTHKCRTGLLVDTKNANDIEFDEVPAGEGDALPAVGTDCIVALQYQVECLFDGDLVVAMGVACSQQAIADFRDAVGSELLRKIPAGSVWTWDTDTGFTNPVATDDIIAIHISNGSITEATLKVGIAHDSVT